MRRGTCPSNSFISLAKRFFACFVFLSVVVGLGSFGLLQARAAATPPRIIMYQGRLLNSNGVPVSDTTASVSFALYDASSAGTCLWSNNSPTCASVVARTVSLTSGLFSEALGDTAATPAYSAIAATVFANNATVYLEVIVNGETLTPRKPMLAAPYAMNSDTVDGYNTTTTGGTSSLIPVTDSNGNLVITGSPQGTGVSQGSLYINPDSGVVAANEVLFGVAITGSPRFTIDSEGDTSIIGDLMVGGSSLVAPFSVDESLNTVRIGDGANDTNDPTLTFYASDASHSGSLSYSDADVFNFSGGNVTMTGLGTMPSTASGTTTEVQENSTFSGTSGASLGTIEMYGMGSTVSYSGIENVTGTDHFVSAGNDVLTINGGTTTVTKGFGTRTRLTNGSTNASLIQGSGYLSATESEFVQSGVATIATGYGIHGVLSASAGTITSGSAIIGEIATSGGTVTTGYAGRFLATAAGTNRYGVYGEASGGSTNYAGYFTGAQVQIDGDSTPDATSYATSAGELYVSGDVETHGGAYFGDLLGTDQFQFVSAVTNADVATIVGNSLTSGNGLTISRGAGGADFDGTLLRIDQLNTSATSDATSVGITNQGGGNSIALRILQNSLSAHSANATGNNAFVIDTNDSPNNDDLMIIRSDVDGTPDTEFRIQSNGDVFGDGATYNSGADYAEFFKTRDAALTDYQVVCQDPGYAEGVRRCSAGDTASIMGVISTNAAFIGNNFRGASDNLDGDTNYRKVGMVGQIDTLVNAGEGSIAIGDAITTSMIMVGYGAKAHGPVRIIGFALEPLSSGTGTIRVLVQPQWYGGDVLTASGGATQVGGSLAIAATTAATASSTVVDSGTLSLRGSAWSGSSAQSVMMSVKTTVNAVNDYRLSVANTTGTEVASVNQSGDLAIAGRLYPSDRGASQTTKYIYYDGSAGSGGDFMRTNASGWATGSYDFAEMFPSPDTLMPGEVVIFGDASQQVKRSSSEPYSRTIAGIVSTRPGFLAGENRVGNFPIALAGRVPTLVSTENGAIHIGDPLTTSTHPGYAMKATEPGPILGYAAEEFTGSMGSVVVYVNVSYYSGAPVTKGPAAKNAVSQLAQDIEHFDTSGTLNFNGGQLLAVGSMTSANGTWKLESDGDIVTSGRLVQLVRSSQGTDVETYAAASRQMTVQLSGMVNLVNGRADVHFADIDPSFTGIIDTTPSYRALVTPYGATGALYVTNRTADGFSIVESGAASSGVSVDWLVIASRRDFAPTRAPETSSTPAPITPSSEPVLEEPAVAPADSAPVDVPISPIVESDTVVSDGVSVPDVAPSVDTPVETPDSVPSDSVPAPETP